MRRLIYDRMDGNDDVYFRDITILFGNISQINRVLRRECPNGHQDLDRQTSGHWRLYRQDNGFERDYICLVRGNVAPEVRAAVLAHETLHLVAYVFRRVGIKLTSASEEAYCYYQQWLMERVYRAIRGKK